MTARAVTTLGVALTAWFAACSWDYERMVDQSRCEPDDRCPAFEDGMANRLPPAGVVAWRPAAPAVDTAATAADGRWVTAIPIELDRSVLARGRDRFDIFCAACHGLAGDGNSEVAENMALRRPPSLISDRIAAYPPGRVLAIIVSGYGLMPPYAAQLSAYDRWAVVAYVGALQLSQRTTLAQLSPALREEADRWLK